MVDSSEESKLRGVGGRMLVPLVTSPPRAHSRTPVRGLGLLGGAQVVEVSAVRAGPDGAVHAHGALARFLGLALASPHVQTWNDSQ